MAADSFAHCGEFWVPSKAVLFASWVTIRSSSRTVFPGVQIPEQLVDTEKLSNSPVFYGTPEFICIRIPFNIILRSMPRASKYSVFSKFCE
jgi:hypothetical protein